MSELVIILHELIWAYFERFVTQNIFKHKPIRKNDYATSIHLVSSDPLYHIITPVALSITIPVLLQLQVLHFTVITFQNYR